MTLDEVKKEYFNLNFDFTQVADHTQAKMHEEAIFVQVLTAIADGKLKGDAAVEVVKYLLEHRRYL